MYLRVENIIHRASHDLHDTLYGSLSCDEKPFYLANLLVDSEDLTFTVEEWNPTEQPHQRLYGCPSFGVSSDHDNDPSRYRARGWARIVGLNNYAAFGAYVKLDLVKRPELVETERLCAKSWDWLWQRRQGSRLARQALTDPEAAFGEYVGWPNRIEQRLRYYDTCRVFLGATV